MPLLRYPGSKDKLYDGALKPLFPSWVTSRLFSSGKAIGYYEPFFGCGAIGFRVMHELPRSCSVWINDKDADLICLWRAVMNEKRPLMRLVWQFVPTAERFFEFKEQDGIAEGSDAERGFRKLALHRMSVSGFGVKSGGPIGGRDQSNKQYTVGCRWNPESIKRDIERLSGLLHSFRDVRITCGDFENVLDSAGKGVFVYADPPYYVKGSQLYKHAMTEGDHERLAAAAQRCKGDWVVSYDDCERVRSLYSWASVHELEVRYSNAVCRRSAGTHRPKNKELAIIPSVYLNGT